MFKSYLTPAAHPAIAPNSPSRVDPSASSSAQPASPGIDNLQERARHVAGLADPHQRWQALLVDLGFTSEDALPLADRFATADEFVKTTPALQEVHVAAEALLAQYAAINEGQCAAALPHSKAVDETTRLAAQHASANLPPPPLGPHSQALVRVLSDQNSIENELSQFIEKKGRRDLAAMTYLAPGLPYRAHDYNRWQNRSGLLFDPLDTEHVISAKRDFHSNRFREISLKRSDVALRYRAAFAPFSQRANSEKLGKMVQKDLDRMNEADPTWKTTLYTDRSTQMAKYAEIRQRKSNPTLDIPSKMHLLDFLEEHDIDWLNTNSCVQLNALVEQKLSELAPDIREDKRKFLNPALAKMAKMPSQRPIQYIWSGGEMKPLHYSDPRNSPPLNEHLCLPKIKDIRGVLVKDCPSGRSHALEIEEALAQRKLPAWQRRLYFHNPDGGFREVTRAEVEELCRLERLHREGASATSRLDTLLESHVARHPAGEDRLRLFPYFDGQRNAALVCRVFAELAEPQRKALLEDGAMNSTLKIARIEQLRNTDDVEQLVADLGMNPEQGISSDLTLDAANSGNPQAFPALREYATKHQQNELFAKALDEAAKEAARSVRPTVMVKLIDAGANLDTRQDEHDLTPLECAILCDNAQCVELLYPLTTNKNADDLQKVAARSENRVGMTALLAKLQNPAAALTP
jgi:hypothetical protein